MKEKHGNRNINNKLGEPGVSGEAAIAAAQIQFQEVGETTNQPDWSVKRKIPVASDDILELEVTSDELLKAMHVMEGFLLSVSNERTINRTPLGGTQSTPSEREQLNEKIVRPMSRAYRLLRRFSNTIEEET